MSCILLTGSTGLIGSFLLRDALRLGLPVAVLARGPSASQRLHRHMQKMQASGPIQVLEGDLGRPDLGLLPEDRRWLEQNCRRILHCAGAVKFQADGGSGEPYRTNLDGTRHLLQLCRQLPIEEFHHVSTAYVCGQRSGPVRENELDQGQSFHNDYERSKFLAELLIEQADHIPVRHIYRPSVVLGEAGSGFSPNFQGAYALLLAGWLKVQQGVGREQFLRLLQLGPEDSINLVSADWVARALLQMMSKPGAGLHRFHLTHPQPTRWADLYDALLACAPESPQAAPSPVVSDAVLDAYAPYFCNHPDFVPGEHSLTCPTLDLQALARYPIERAFQSEEEVAVSELLDRLPRSPLAITLEVAGHGPWPLGASTEPTIASAFCSSRTLLHLRQGKLTLEQALYSGQLVVEGEELEQAIDGLARVLQP